MKSKRYEGEFRAIDGTLWRVELWQESATAYPNAIELRFPWNAPLVFTWDVQEKHAAVEKSRAELTVVSPGDRTFLDLYSVASAQVRMDVYRNGLFYWTGTLDTEQYSEPYEDGSDYDVKLVFGDFGVLDRIRHTGTGLQTLSDIVGCALAAADISVPTDWSMTGTTVSADYVEDVTCVDGSNWVDDDGSHRPWLEVLEGALAPLGLRMRQKNGKVYLYTIHSLYTTAFAAMNRGVYPEKVHWSGTEQDLDVDVVYNNVCARWKTNCISGDLVEGDFWGDIQPDTTLFAYTHTPVLDARTGATYTSFPVDMLATSESESMPCFTMWLTPDGAELPVEVVGENATSMTIVAQNGGTTKDCVAVAWETAKLVSTGGASSQFRLERHGLNLADGNFESMFFDSLTVTDAQPIYRTKRVYLPHSDSNLMLRISIPLLIRPDGMPFEEITKSTGWLNRAYMPVRICFQPTGSAKVYVWSNRANLAIQSIRDSYIWRIAHTFGSWVEQTDTTIQGWLGYYTDEVYDGNTDSSKETPFKSGFADNRPALGTKIHRMSDLVKNTTGQLIPYPAAGSLGGGELWLEVLDKGWDLNHKAYEGEIGAITDVVDYHFSATMFFQTMGWVVIGIPTIEIKQTSSRTGAVVSDLDTSDVVFDMELNPSAKEELSLEHDCGSAAYDVPGSRSAYVTTGGAQIRNFSRGGHTGCAAELLGNTLFSQYSDRCLILKGEATIMSGAWAAVSEENSGNTIFMLSGEEQDAHQGCGEIQITEIRPDEYTPA